jgi:hypothetical protein
MQLAGTMRALFAPKQWCAVADGGAPVFRAVLSVAPLLVSKCSVSLHTPGLIAYVTTLVVTSCFTYPSASLDVGAMRAMRGAAGGGAVLTMVDAYRYAISIHGMPYRYAAAGSHVAHKHNTKRSASMHVHATMGRVLDEARRRVRARSAIEREERSTR